MRWDDEKWGLFFMWAASAMFFFVMAYILTH